MKTRDLIDLLVLGAIWGASFLFMRVAAPEFGAIPLIAARVGIAAIFLIMVLARRGGLPHLYPNAARLTLLGAVNSAIPFSLFAYAVLSVTAGFASVLNSTAPLFGALVAFIWLRDRPAPAPDRGVDCRLCGRARARVGQTVRGERRGRRGGARRVCLPRCCTASRRTTQRSG